MDDLRDTRDTLAIGVSNQLHGGRVNPYFARCRSHCVGIRTLSETMTAAMICHIFANTRDLLTGIEV